MPAEKRQQIGSVVIDAEQLDGPLVVGQPIHDEFRDAVVERSQFSQSKLIRLRELRSPVQYLGLDCGSGVA
jgi:hypothetical protein